MKHIIRVLSLLMVMCLAISFAACDKEQKKEEKKSEPKEKYVIYSDAFFAPFEYYDEDAGAYIGVDIDLLSAIAEASGFEYEMKHVGFDTAMKAVKSGEADGMIAAMTINEKRKVSFDFSDGYFKDGVVLATHKDSGIESYEDLAGKTVALKATTVGATYAESIMEKYGFDIVYYENSPAVYQAIENGEAEAFFEDYSVVAWEIKDRNGKFKIVGETVNTGYYGFAVKKGENAELIEKFNRGLKIIKENGVYDDILRRYGYSGEG